MTVMQGLKIEDRTTLVDGNRVAATTGDLVEAQSVIVSEARQVSLRIPPQILDRVDTAVKSRLVHIPRHTWLLEAIVEKLDRESSHSRSGHGTE